MIITAAAIVLCCTAGAGAAITCYDCHGSRTSETAGDYRPIDDPVGKNRVTGGVKGNHRTHMTAPASPSACTPCHPGSDRYTTSHRDGKVDLAFNINSSAFPAGYSKGIFSNQTTLPAPGTCSSVNCHFETTTPSWGSPRLNVPQNCDACHGAPPADGNHPSTSGKGKKHGDALGTGTESCNKCHADHLKDANQMAHALDAGKRRLIVQFTTSPNSGGNYSGDTTYPAYLPRGGSSRNGSCTNLYCHSDAMGRAPGVAVKWSDSTSLQCDGCHRGTSASFQSMTSNGHKRLVDPTWIRQYPCTYCHSATVASLPVAGKPPVDGAIIPLTYVNGQLTSCRHVNGTRDVVINDFWKITGNRKTYDPPRYDPVTKVCSNVYCHSDGTVDPDPTKDFPWNWRAADGTRIGTQCNSCHGHDRGSCSDCHDGVKKYYFNNHSTVLSVQERWTPGEEWKSAMPMFPNEGVGRPRANSHSRHLATDFSCDECHRSTIAAGGDCKACHKNGVTGSFMSEVSHLVPAFHVNKFADVAFKRNGPNGKGGTYNSNKSCSGTACHTGADPVWGASVDNGIICLSCHGTYASPDLDDYGKVNTVKAQINLNEWRRTGHGRTMSNYSSGNPPAGFPGNPCWYCHDNRILHNYSGNPFRLRLHSQFNNRFERECVFCHMTGTDPECMNCHNSGGSLAPQLLNITSSSHPHAAYADGATSCVTTCHATDSTQHKTGAGTWTTEQKSDVKNQYMMMGVCLQCHDDDSNGKCNGCHDGTNPKYTLGFDPGTGFRKPVKARASSIHFGHKHYKGFLDSGGWEKDANGKVKGKWRGGKFCWDCHDPHGDSNLYMVHDYVSTETDGRFGIPTPGKQKHVVFKQKNTGGDYAKSNGTIDGICNVCHQTGSQHYREDGGDGHNSSYVCTRCHEHRFTDSHGGKDQSCGSCHKNKPVPRHSGFGLPRDCTKCHSGDLNARVDVMAQFRGKSHHIQGVQANNKHCYQCHWEATDLGLIDVRYHEGYNYKNYSTTKNAKVDLVVYGPGFRPAGYREYSTAAGRATAVQFTASNISSPSISVERKEVEKITNTCISCHSDQNNDTTPFNDCKTPRQYAWDRQSIDARYSQKRVTKWGKYSTATTNKKHKVVKALSAHGNASANQGGWNPANGTDSTVADSRGGFTGISTARHNVQCFDCHNSHGNTKAIGVTSSYVSYSGLKSGGNLKEVTAGKGGYKVTYFAKGKANGTNVVNPYSTGAGQCFDCHMTENKATEGIGMPWGYRSTFNATQPIKGYRDGYRFGERASDQYKLGTAFKAGKTIIGGHFKATRGGLTRPVMGTIDGLCTPCHDPHGVSPTLENLQSSSIPLLKDTWLSSPYKEDQPPPNPTGTNSIPDRSWGTPQYQGRKYPGTTPVSSYRLDRDTLGTTETGTPKKIAEDDAAFAGLCLKCHTRTALLGNYTGAVGSATGANKAPWKSVERVHAAVKGWGTNKEHANPCSKCHQPHNSALPRLMQTNCLDYNHRGGKESLGVAWSSLMALTSVNGVSWRNIDHSSSRTQLRGYPIANELGTAVEASISCHVSRFNLPFSIGAPATGTSASPVPSQWPGENYWNGVTPW